MGSKKRQRNEISRTRKTFDLATGYHIRGGEGDGYRGAEYQENFNGMVEILQLERRNREEREREEERKHN